MSGAAKALGHAVPGESWCALRTVRPRGPPSLGERRGRAERSDSTRWSEPRTSSPPTAAPAEAGGPGGPPQAPPRWLREAPAPVLWPRAHRLPSTHLGRPATSMTLARVTSLDHTSYCYLRRPRTPQRTLPVCSPTRTFRSNSVASATDLQETGHGHELGPRVHASGEPGQAGAWGPRPVGCTATVRCQRMR